MIRHALIVRKLDLKTLLRVRNSFYGRHGDSEPGLQFPVGTYFSARESSVETYGYFLPRFQQQ